MYLAIVVAGETNPQTFCLLSSKLHFPFRSRLLQLILMYESQQSVVKCLPQGKSSFAFMRLNCAFTYPFYQVLFITPLDRFSSGRLLSAVVVTPVVLAIGLLNLIRQKQLCVILHFTHVLCWNSI